MLSITKYQRKAQLMTNTSSFGLVWFVYYKYSPKDAQAYFAS